MARREHRELIQDVIEAITRIQAYSAGLPYAEFLRDTKTQDAIVRNLEVIGEAAKKLSVQFRTENKHVRWQDIMGMRDRLIHQYFGTNWEIVWDVVCTKLPELKEQLTTTISGTS